VSKTGGNKKRNSQKQPKTHLDEVDREIIRLKLQNPELTYKEIAQKLHYRCANSIKQRFYEPLLQREMELAGKSALAIIKKAQEEASRVALELLRTGSEATRARMATLLVNGLPAIASGALKTTDESSDGIQIAEKFGQMVHAAGTGKTAQDDHKLPHEPGEISDGSCGEEIVQNGDSQADFSQSSGG
jgi:hypothetical protein